MFYQALLRTFVTFVSVSLVMSAFAAPRLLTIGQPPGQAEKKIDASLLAPQVEKKLAVRGGSLVVSSPRKFVAAKGKRVNVIVGCKQVSYDFVKKLPLRDSAVTGVFPEYNCITVAVGSESDLRTLAAQDNVVRIRPAMKGQPNAGVAESQADFALQTFDVREGRYLDGLSQKVGILSDSFAYGPPVRNDSTTPPQNESGTLRGATPQLTGDLPPEVEILADDAALYWEDYTPSDEGEAMAELIHDIAPGAALAFHTAEPSYFRMASGITALKNAGCTIITDDYTYWDEPWFMESPVSTAISSAIKGGVAYFTCAGNSGDSAIRLPYRDIDPTQSEENYPPQLGADFADWGGGYGAYLPITFYPPSSEVLLVLQWNQPWETLAPATGGSQIDMDLYVLPDPVPPALAAWYFDSADEQGDTGDPYGDPIEYVFLSYTGSESYTAYLAVDHYWGKQDRIPQNKRTPVEFWLWAYRAEEGGVAVPVVGPVTTGHQTAAGVACVAAVPFYEAPWYDPVAPIEPEWFTARGGTISIPFDSAGRFRPRTAVVPNIAAVDGCDTLFFGSWGLDDGTPFPNFFGTSAAAPNAAAVAALLRQADSKLKPFDVLKILSQTATDVTGDRAAVGFDSVTGAGLINGQAAISKIRKGENLTIFPYVGDSVPTVTTKNGWQPNLWDRLVLRNTADFGPQPETLAPGEVYAWFAVANTGTSEAGKPFVVNVLVDGVVVQSLTAPPMFGPSIMNAEAVPLGSISEGPHVFEVRVDTTNRIRELNERDNVYSETVTVMSDF